MFCVVIKGLWQKPRLLVRFWREAKKGKQGMLFGESGGQCELKQTLVSCSE